MIIVLMGVSGSGKTVVGRALAAELGWAFVEGDDYHPRANVEKMRGGAPLDEDDRRPWLAALRRRLEEACAGGGDAVLACSALGRSHREELRRGCPGRVRFVHLVGPQDLIRRRLEGREGHFMHPGLIRSQFEALEAPADATPVDASPPPEVVAADVRRRLGL